VKKAAIKKILGDMPGFRRHGSFFIGNCNDSVLSGYCLDSPAECLYIWRFILPSYDNIEFLHLALGKRILSISKGTPSVGVDVADFLQRDWVEFCKVKDTASFVSYLDEENFEGAYIGWAKYLTYIWRKEFSRAERILSESDTLADFSKLKVIATNFAILSRKFQEQGWSGCEALLDDWVLKTKSTYC
jgi:hypothetical protein